MDQRGDQDPQGPDDGRDDETQGEERGASGAEPEQGGDGQPGFRPSGTPGKAPGQGGSGNPLEDLLGPLLGGLGGQGGAGAGGFPGLPGGFPGGIPGLGDGPLDPALMGQVLAQLQKFLSTPSDAPVNWDVAHDLARQAAAQAGDPTPGDAERRAVEDALRVADLWLDGVTDLEQAPTTPEAWSRADWVERTMPVWRQLVEPVATNVANAMGEAMAAQAPPEMAAMLGSAGAMLRQVGGGVFGMQVGQAIGTLAGEVLSTTDIGLPLAPGGRAALLPAGVSAFAEGLEVPLDEVRRYLALREAAHQRLFAHVPWLRSHLLGSVESFARGISVDAERIAEAARSVDPANPESLQEALGSGIFEPESTPAQKVALVRLETALALVEGWVDHVTDEAAGRVLPHAAALRETVRRRRATGGPAEHAFAVLVGLELRPRRAREAAALWEQLLARGDRAARDAVWDHPDLLPTAEDLDDVAGFVERRLSGGPRRDEDEMDAALRDLLDGPSGEEPGGEPGGEPREG
ncbi:zinc-dependent metalloprotease [Paenibacillus sp. TRM 82003]|uniref:zinc-dependent metalloprotease n=1 Tax=Kineococcus sp. TRM81007 TaxID=2925831 RepID=UPI001F57E371|nr:zinc-dependent metalloprotease [Kineococcus sp. TRM81007]MCI2239213.1 zinc-dependent metalloprotease [Kineococcus sp. TRM81007]MCI3924892.1 zinc-dependent metalloprotease [Paenibacillus sp. TRM 82003]